MESIKLMSYNGNGLGDEAKLKSALNWAKRYKPDILPLQETHCWDNRKTWYNQSWAGECIHSIGKSNKKGVSILFSKQLDYKILDQTVDIKDRYVILDLVINDRKILLGNYYGKNKDKPGHLENLLNMLYPDEGQEVIFGGDFNLVRDLAKDKKGGRVVTHVKSRENHMIGLQITD